MSDRFNSFRDVFMVREFPPAVEHRSNAGSPRERKSRERKTAQTKN